MTKLKFAFNLDIKFILKALKFVSKTKLHFRKDKNYVYSKRIEEVLKIWKSLSY